MCEWVVCLFVLLLSQHYNQPDVYESEDPEPVTSTTCGDDTTSGAVEELPSGVKTAYGQFNSRLLDSRFTGTSHKAQMSDMG